MTPLGTFGIRGAGDAKIALGIMSMSSVAPDLRPMTQRAQTPGLTIANIAPSLID